MSAARGMHGYQATLWYAVWTDPLAAALPGVALDDNNVAWTRIGEVISINGLSLSNTVTELTHLTSDGFAKEKIPGFMDAGQLNFRLNYYAAHMLALAELLPAGTVGTAQAAGVAGREAWSWGRLSWCVQFPDFGQMFFDGFLNGLPFTVPEDDRITIDATVEVSGRPIFAEI